MATLKWFTVARLGLRYLYMVAFLCLCMSQRASVLYVTARRCVRKNVQFADNIISSFSLWGMSFGLVLELVKPGWKKKKKHNWCIKWHLNVSLIWFVSLQFHNDFSCTLKQLWVILLVAWMVDQVKRFNMHVAMWAIVGEAEVSLQGRDLPSGVAGCFLVEPVCTVAIKMITENHEKLVGGRSIGCGCDGPVLDFRESFSSHIPSCVPEMLGANPKWANLTASWFSS